MRAFLLGMARSIINNPPVTTNAKNMDTARFTPVKK